MPDIVMKADLWKGADAFAERALGLLGDDGLWQ